MGRVCGLRMRLMMRMMMMMLLLVLLVEAEVEVEVGEQSVSDDMLLFPTLDSMLHWAIGHSDVVKLKQTAQHVQRLSPDDLKVRQMEVKALMENFKTPSDAQLMQIAIDDLNNSTLSLEDHLRALEELLILVEPIVNANDLDKLGGLTVVIQQLNHPDPEMRRASAWILGKASQNNPLVQNQVLEYGALTKLMEMVRSTSAEEANKAFYALSALVRNNLDGQTLFYAQAGDLMLQDLLSNSSIDMNLQRKIVFLVGDLAECQLAATDTAEIPPFSNRFFLKSVVDLTVSADLDLKEKGLVAIKKLLLLKTTEEEDIVESGLDVALERVREELEQLMLDEDRREYVIDIETLRRQVELTFHTKLHNL